VNPTDHFPRLSLGHFPTPIRRLHHLEQALGGGHLLLKRDDLAGFALAGNKTRPLEFLIADATSTGCDVVVGGGAPKSNFIAALAAAASVGGIACELLISGAALVDPPPTLRLAEASGARLTFTGGDREHLDEEIDARASALNRDGHHAYAVPRGGACAVGALGFASGASEIAGQGVPDNATIVLAVGSGSSVAGLNAGRGAIGANWQIIGVSVSRPLEEMRRHVTTLTRACTQLLEVAAPSDAVIVDASMTGMGTTTDAERMIVSLAYESEGLLFDPSYGAKALVEVQRLVRTGFSRPIVLWHTGGLPSALSLLTTEKGA